MSASESERSFIKKVHLKGYKSIRDLSVELSDGLNIIIGANGSGKTNFLEFLKYAGKGDYASLLDKSGFYFEINESIYNTRVESELFFNNETKKPNYKIQIMVDNGKVLKSRILTLSEQKTVENIKYIFDEKGKIPLSNFSSKIYETKVIEFENPLRIALKNKFSLNATFKKFVSTKSSDSVLYSYTKTNEIIADTFIKDIMYFSDRFVDSTSNLIEKIKSNIEEEINNKHIREHLERFSPIKNFKIDWDLVRISEEDNDSGKEYLIEGIDFKFFVNDEWLNWSQLSDGTKRLFYIIGSVTYTKQNAIILLEEPELGVHPHQLSLLMNFLKSQSSDKQIIITTHSPQVLNCLEADELDRIIVARHEGKEGTKMYHLSEKEKGIVAKYMQNDAFIGDYWTLSGFMQEENAEVE